MCFHGTLCPLSQDMVGNGMLLQEHHRFLTVLSPLTRCRSTQRVTE